MTAIRTLTVLPVPGRDVQPLSASLYWFPFVGLLLGALEYGVGTGVARLTHPVWPEAVAVAVVVAGALLTRGLHLDGLADWADAAGVLSTREKRLEVMKDPRVGALGAVALICVVLTKWVALTRLAEADALLYVVGACIVSRAMQVELAGALPYARSDGGTAADFVNRAGIGHRIVAILGAALLSALLHRGLGIVLLLTGLLLARVFAIWCRSRLGGVTGDLLGACSEVTETAVLLVAALAVGGPVP